MADFTTTIRKLQEQRRALVDQVAAIDRAIAALSGIDKGTGGAPAPAPRHRQAKPKARKRHFVMSEEHKQKLLEGQRRAREARAAAAPREPAAPANPPASVDLQPRLVRRPAEG
jgi:hypothetical protein